MRTFMLATLALLLGACATTPPYPGKRPLTAANTSAIGATTVVVDENNNGIEKTWFMTDSSAAGAQYGLLGALITGAMDAIINSGPSHRAQKAADEIAASMPVDALNASLVKAFRDQITSASDPRPGIRITDAKSVQKVLAPDPVNKAVEVAVSYSLSEDASALRVAARASYLDDGLKYATPYDFKGNVPKSELSGPVYANSFTYYSDQLPVPTLTPELKERLVASIQDSYRNEAGAAPAADSKEFKAMSKELDQARDDKLTKPEIAIFLTREWLKDGGARLRREIDNANAFIVKYLTTDLATTAVPKLDGQDELLETLPDQRTVRRIGAGQPAGSYVSAPGNVATFVTYGNASGIAKSSVERTKALNEEARHAKPSQTK